MKRLLTGLKRWVVTIAVLLCVVVGASQLGDEIAVNKHRYSTLGYWSGCYCNPNILM